MHPSMDSISFSCSYLNKLWDNVYNEQKSIVLLGDFNANHLNYNEHNQKNKFLDSLTFHPVILSNLQPTRITSYDNTLLENIFSNVIYPGIMLDNLTATISYHWPQFAIIQNVIKNIWGSKSII